jgi:hypothetical protein
MSILVIRSAFSKSIASAILKVALITSMFLASKSSFFLNFFSIAESSDAVPPEATNEFPKNLLLQLFQYCLQ